jgi:hypothetical protein
MFDNQINTSIQANSILNREDKTYLSQTLVKLNPLEKLKLKTTLDSDDSTALKSMVELIKIKFPIIVKTNTGFFGKISQFINPPKPQKIVSPSILSTPATLGGPVPTPFPIGNTLPYQNTNEFSDLAQLATLDQSHFIIGTEQQEDINLQKFLEKLDYFFDQIVDTQVKRSYFASFVTSPLFNSYMNTGLTAIRHPEIEPREIILNTLHLTNNNYLDKRKFEIASIVTNHLRHQCGI